MKLVLSSCPLGRIFVLPSINLQRRFNVTHALALEVQANVNYNADVEADAPPAANLFVLVAANA